VKDLTIILSEGASSISGKVVVASGSLPQNLYVYLVPAERAGEALRLAQTSVQSEGAFSLTNIAPGRYWMLAGVIADEELTAAMPRPLAWDDAGRRALRKEAEAANQLIEVQMCQPIVGYLWRLGLQTVVTKPPAKKPQ
jgi:hypothetical protein